MKITWYGTATIALESEGTRILFDPFNRKNRKLRKLDPSAFADFDALLLTHGHFDHLTGVRSVLEAAPSMPVYCTETPKRTLVKKGVAAEKIRLIAPGDRFTVGSVQIRILPGRHIRFDRGYVLSILPREILRFPRTFYLLWLIRALPENGETVAFEITAEGKTVLLMGSFGVHPDAEYPVLPDLFIFPFSGNSGIRDLAADFLQALQPKQILFDHFDNAFPPLTNRMDVEGYCEYLAAQYPATGLHVPVEGEPFHI